MKKIGYLIITIAFLAGALAAVVDKTTVHWGYFCGSLAGGIVGVVLVRLHEHKACRCGEKLASNLQDVKTCLTRIAENITRLNSEKQSINIYDIRHRIDELFVDDLATFSDARSGISQAYGLQTYADIMSHFASGERYLYRVWSASTDGYIDEAAIYLEKAQTQFTEALDKFRRLNSVG